ncbi:unnamed protein product [Aureobasidium uvarum]|uniref:Uncharacterized protein n=1 Tax=Aureobasidium uvarum TaxID=2773716 RepID=A0A9N8KPZ4_9PEZI|nr:unnamed protein product [Aureobasidium uvarum]
MRIWASRRTFSSCQIRETRIQSKLVRQSTHLTNLETRLAWNVRSDTPASSHHRLRPWTAHSTSPRPTLSTSTSLSSPCSRNFSSSAIALITKESYAELRKNPERLEQYLEERRAAYRRQSPERREFYLERLKQRYWNDHEHRERLREAARHKTTTGQMRKRLHLWCTRYAWFRESVSWKSHLPLHTEDKVRHHCDGCGYERFAGLKLWWTKLVDRKPRYLCHKCYCTTRGWNDVMPTGYEDIKSFKELSVRKKQLEQPGSGGTNFAVPTASSTWQSTFSRPGSEKAVNIALSTSRKFSSGPLHRRKTSYATMRSNPEAWRAYLDKIAVCKQKRHDEDPEFRTRRRQTERLGHEQMKSDPAYLT